MAALKPGEVNLGTTIMAVKFDGGVVIAADSRTSIGPYVANRVTDKLTKVNDLIYCCRSGSAADTQAVADIVKYHLDLYTAQHDEPPTVKVAASLFQEICYQNKDNLSAAIIVAGWDEQSGGSVFEIPPGGSLHTREYAINGSGSVFSMGYCDKVFRPGMSKDECVEMVKNAVGLSITRDGSSGGVIRVAVITNEGVERQIVYGNELPPQFTG
ncbi:Proteasome subunit beta type-1 [Coemansia erecta]|nr:Proteasome subunit beta type-1 [Coemansia erecta]